MLGEDSKRVAVGQQSQKGVGARGAGDASPFEAGRADWEHDEQGRERGRVGLDGEGGRLGRGATEKEKREENERWRMTMPSNPTSAVPPSRALAQQRYNQASDLEKQLRALLQTKGPFDPTVRALRTRVCESYESVILEDHELAETHDVEQGIWRLHYKCIEEFRNRMRKTTAAAAAAASAPAIPMPGAKVTSSRRDGSQKVLSVFKSFLAEATGFYHNLISKLRAKHGLPQYYSPFESEPVGPAQDEQRAAELKACDLSCHRCLIFLGDLARYKETHGDADTRNRDWSVAAGYYQQAISLWPSSGNPHNQLAVLATYVGDELLAVYRYFRSLAVENPFLTARDNLIILFEKNRNYYAQLPMREAATSGGDLDQARLSDKKSTKGDRILPVGDGVLKLAVKDHNLGSANSGEIRKSFRIRFVRLNGILFTKTSLETFAEVYAATVRELETLLSPDDAKLEAGLGLDHRSGIGTGSSGAAGFLQLIAILIFTVHNINWGLDSHHPTYAEVLQRSALFQHAFTAAFECAGRLMRRCADFKDILKSPLLPAMLVFLEWLACRPEMASGSDVDEKQASARAFFWRQTVSLLNSCTVVQKMHGDTSLDGAANGFEDEESFGGFALWEDYELRGFVSVLPAQVTLDYSRRAPRTGLGDKKERSVRIRRLWAAGKAIANALEGTDKGIIYDEHVRKFYMIGDVREEKVRDTDASSGLDDIGALPDEIVEELEKSSVTTWLTESQENGSSTATLSDPFPQGEEEEDEEVIVFKPIVKDVPVLSSAPDPAWKDVVGAQNATAKSSIIIPGCGDSTGPNANRKVSLTVPIPRLDEQQPAPVPFHGKSSETDVTSGNFEGPNVVVGRKGQESSIMFGRPANSSGPSVITAMSPVSGVYGFTTDAEIGGVKSTYGYAPSSAEEWLNQIARSSGAFPSATLPPWDAQSVSNIFGNGSEKSPSVAGVIGQPRQDPVSNSLWSTSLDSLSLPGFSSPAVGDSDFNARQGGQLRGVLPHANTSLDSLLQASTKETKGASHTPFSGALAANGMVHSEDYVNSTQNGTTGYPYVQSTSGYPVTGRRSPFVKPQAEKAVPVVSKQPSLTNGPSVPATPANGVLAKDNTSASARLSGMRPPPGFGPLPANPSTNNVGKGTSQSASQPRKNIPGDEREDQQVDDYGWLDDYSQKRNSGQAGFYQGQGSSLYSSDYGIWSSGSTNNQPPVSKTPTTYPFPGMGISEQDQLEKQRERYSVQLLQQLLQQHQMYDTPRVDYGMEQQDTNYGVQPFEYDAQQHYQLQQQQFLSQKQKQQQEEQEQQQLQQLQQQQQQHQQHQQQQQQQQQQVWGGQYNVWEPFVS